MKILLLVFSILAIWHFIYEGMVAPTIRSHLRNQLFAIRDELRKAKSEGLSDRDELAFRFVHQGVNNFLNRLPYITLQRVKLLADEINLDDAKRHLLDHHIQAVKRSENERIRTAFIKANTVLERAFLVNMGSWFIYILPLAMIIGGLTRLSNLVAEIFVSSAKDVERLIPQT